MPGRAPDGRKDDELTASSIKETKEKRHDWLAEVHAISASTEIRALHSSADNGVCL